jgi:glutathione S-transferase
MGTQAYRDMRYYMHYTEGSAMPILLLWVVANELPKHVPWPVKSIGKAISQGLLSTVVSPQLNDHMTYWDDALKATGWFAGDQFSVADIMMSFPLEAAYHRTGADKYPQIVDFLNRIHARTAYGRALERGGKYAYS